MNRYRLLCFVLLSLYFCSVAEAAISGSISLPGNSSVCQNTASPTVRFTATGGVAPYKFTYTINGGSSIVSANSTGVLNVSVPTSIPGVFLYSLTNIKDNTGTSVMAYGTATVTVNEVPVVDFTFINNQCASAPIQFTSTVTGGGSYIYSWNFGDGTPADTRANPSHFFVSTGSGTQAFNVTLTVTNALTNCSASTPVKVITVKRSLDSNLQSSGTASVIDGVTTFSTCNVIGAATMTFLNPSSNVYTKYTINWGDGTSDFVSNGAWLPTTHKYNSGSYTLTYTVQGTGTCPTVVRTFRVFVGDGNPGGAIVSPGNTNICKGQTLTFPISVVNNPPGTTYTITFNDGTAPIIYDQATVPASITHKFDKNSCGITSSNNGVNYPNSYSASIEIKNPCGSTNSAVAPIYVSEIPTPDFIVATPTVCTNAPATIKDDSKGSAYVGASSCLAPTRVWKISPMLGVNISATALGNDGGDPSDYSGFTGGSVTINPQFTIPGTYHITLITGGRCGTNQITKDICVESPPVVTFGTNAPPSSEICAGETVNFTNSTSVASFCGIPTKTWSINYTAANCGTSANYSITAGGLSQDNVSILFVNPGKYEVSLLVSNVCSVVPPAKQTIIVKKPPTVIVNTIADRCDVGTVHPTAIVQNCTSNVGTVTYEWSFPGGTPSTATTLDPGIINYPATSTTKYRATLKVTNECGAFSDYKEFYVKQVTQMTNSSFAQSLCSGQTTVPVPLTATLAGTTFAWSATATAGISNFTANGTAATLPGMKVYNSTSVNGTITYTITPSFNGCSGLQMTYTITVLPAPSIVTQPKSSSVCPSGTPDQMGMTFINMPTSGPATTYEWFNNGSTNSNVGGVSTGITTATFDPPVTATVGTTYYYCKIYVPAAATCPDLLSNTASVTVVQPPVMDLLPVPTQTVCVGGSIPALTVPYSHGAGAPSYKWYYNTAASTVGAIPVLGVTTSTYTPPAFATTGNNYYYAELNFPGSNCGSLVSGFAEVIVVPDPAIGTQPLAAQAVCVNTSSTPLTISATGGYGTLQYKWYVNTSNNTTSGSFIALATNTTYTPLTTTLGTKYYYCKVTNSGGAGCEAISNVAEVKVVAEPTISLPPQSKTLCEGDPLPTLTTAYLNGTGTPTYQWYKTNLPNNSSGLPIDVLVNPSAATLALTTTDIAVGTSYYYCVINLAGGNCNQIRSNAVAVTIHPKASISPKTDTKCSGNSFLVNPTNGGGDIVPPGTTYTWTMPTIVPVGSVTGASARNIAQSTISQALFNSTGLAGVVTYTVTPTTGSCTGASFPVTVTVNPSVRVNATIKNSTCYGAGNGSITVAIAGGVPFSGPDPYTVSWTGPNSYTGSGTTITNLKPGNYTITVTENGGCPYTEVYKVTEPTEVLVGFDSKKDVSCFGAADGEIKVTVSGGEGPYNYQWKKNGVDYAITEDIGNLSKGTYTLEATDKNGCVSKIALYTITESPLLVIDLVGKTNIKCHGENMGSIQINVSGGAPKQVAPGVYQYNYSWTGPDGFTSTTKDIGGLKAGIYNLTVTDSVGCGKPANFQITEPDPLVINTTVAQITCNGGNNGSINVTTSGGTLPHTVTWNTLASGNFQNSLSAGDYIITVTDKEGCQKSDTVKIVNPLSFSVNPVMKQISCNGANDGSIDLHFVGTLATTKLTWSDGSNAGSIRNNLAAGTYSVIVGDGLPCGFSRSFVIVNPNPITLTANITNAIDCNNSNSGAVNLIVQGGTPPYAYLWTNGETTEDLASVSPGTYAVTVTDANLCAKTSMNYVVTRPVTLTATVTSVLEFECDNNRMVSTSTARATGGVPPYTFSWSNGLGKGSTKETMTTPDKGTVILTVTDALGCWKDFSYVVDIPAVGIDYSVDNCYANKVHFKTIVPSNKDAYTYLWDFDDGTSAITRNPNHRFPSSGNYNVKLTLTTSTCSSVFKLLITVMPLNMLSLDKAPMLCKGESSVFHATGADTYKWSDGTTTDSITINKEGTYSVIGKSISGCADTLYFKIQYPDLYGFSIESDKDEVSSADSPITFWTQSIPFAEYYWEFGDGKSANTDSVKHVFDISFPGHYDVKLNVTNPNGCTETAVKRIWVIADSKINTFSPNGDGVNDFFMKNWHIQVFNRNGIFIYEGDDGWDGTYKGQVVKNDTYFYLVYFKTAKGTKTKSGYVTVVR
jgi:large repetitive protein